MKHNINVIKSVWRRVRKPSRATLDAVSSKNAICTEVFSETDILAEQTDLTMVANLNKAGWGLAVSQPWILTGEQSSITDEHGDEKRFVVRRSHVNETAAVPRTHHRGAVVLCAAPQGIAKEISVFLKCPPSKL